MDEKGQCHYSTTGRKHQRSHSSQRLSHRRYNGIPSLRNSPSYIHVSAPLTEIADSIGDSSTQPTKLKLKGLTWVRSWEACSSRPHIFNYWSGYQNTSQTWDETVCISMLFFHSLSLSQEEVILVWRCSGCVSGHSVSYAGSPFLHVARSETSILSS